MEDLRERAIGAEELEIRIDRGDITVRCSDSTDWGIEWSGGGETEPRIEREGPTLIIRQQSHTFRRLDLSLTIPRGVHNVEVRTGMGRISVEGIDGHLNAEDGNGAVTVRSCSGDASINSGNGKLQVEHFRGRLNLTTGIGSIDGVDLHGSLTVSTGNGRVELRDADGEIRIATGNGDISLDATGGTATLETGHGKVAISAARALHVEATTAAGSIEVSGGTLQGAKLTTMMGEVYCGGDLLPDEYELETAVGSVTLSLPSSARVRVDAQTSFGKVHSDIPLVRVGRSGPMGFGGERMVGSIGEGEPLVQATLRTTHGQIRVRQTRNAAHDDAPRQPYSGDESPAYEQAGERTTAGLSASESSSEPVAEPQTQTTLAVLEALARGEISPDEADALLYGARA